MTGDVRAELGRVAEQVKGRFDAQRRVLSFHEYLALLADHPGRHLRDAAVYLRDAFDHFGAYEVERGGVTYRRWRLFDLAWGGGAGREHERQDHLVGHEPIQEAFYQALTHFSQEGRPNRLVLMHGPNGSAKSTFAQCLMRGIEAYSMADEGALYRFSWIFPRGRDGKSIGFGGLDEGARAGSYAHLPEAQVDARLAGELREHPLHLLPVDDRRQLLERIGVGGRVPDWLARGQLSQRNQRIFEALLTAYRGDLARVLDHVRVERFYVSRHYRTGAVTIGPEMAVDAHERQITADHSIQALPASLASLTLFEPFGALVNASGGIVEFSDLLKRPLDAWKYLLLAIENGEVSLPMSNLTLNAVLIASSNEIHMRAFREHPDYNSFRGRLHLIRVPYLLDYRQEQGIYESQIVPQVRTHVAPHSAFVAALWAVLTRLRRAAPDAYDSTARGRVAADLSPLEKAEYYATGTVPERLPPEDARELVDAVLEVQREGAHGDAYEGLEGASPREVRGILLDAAARDGSECLSPLSVLEAIASFVEGREFDFLRQTPDRGYHDHRGFIGVVRECWLDRVDHEVRVSTGLIEETQYVDLFRRYVTHVSVALKGEKVRNPVTGKDEDPDGELLERVESTLGVSRRAQEFRQELISAVAAHAIDHPGSRPDPAALFPRHVARMREAYFQEKREQVGVRIRDALTSLSGGTLPPDRHARAAEFVTRIQDGFGYTSASAKVALGELSRERYIPG